MAVQPADESREGGAPRGIEPRLVHVLRRRLGRVEDDRPALLERQHERDEAVRDRLGVAALARQRFRPLAMRPRVLQAHAAGRDRALGRARGRARNPPHHPPDVRHETREEDHERHH